MTTLTAEEAAIYDRQLRVWGVEAQQRMRSSKVLVLGCRGAAIEVTKNLVLAGIGLLHLVDDAVIADTTLPGNFLVPASPDILGSSLAEQCDKGLKQMNPLVDVSSEIADPNTYFETVGGKNLEQYNAVIAFDMSATAIRALDERCAALNIPLCACTSRGVSGWIFLNPQQHEYVVENTTEDEKTGAVTKTVTQNSISGVAFGKVVEEMVATATAAAAARTSGGTGGKTVVRRRKRQSAAFDVVARCLELELETGEAVSMNDLDQIRKKVIGLDHSGNDTEDAVGLIDYLEGSCVPAVNAVLGGIMANDVIKLVSKKGALGVDRMFCYSVIDDAGWIV